MGDLLAPLSFAVAKVDADSIARQHTVSPAELDRHFLSHGSSVHILGVPVLQTIHTAGKPSIHSNMSVRGRLLIEE